MWVSPVVTFIIEMCLFYLANVDPVKNFYKDFEKWKNYWVN